MHPASSYVDLDHAPALADIAPDEPVWEVLKRIAATLEAFDWSSSPGAGEISPGAHVGEKVHLGAGTRVEPGAVIKGPAWIGENCQVRSGAYVRENVIVGNGVVLGNSCEFKNCLVFDGAEVPHYNYVGDSVLGHRAHLGAGVILSNVRLDRRNVVVPASVESGADRVDTGLRKFGAIVGDGTEVGCNSVLSPGSLVGRECVLYPGTQWRGVLPSNTIVKLVQEQVLIARR